MKNILNEVDYLEIKRRIQKLSETNTRLWGEMEIQEMLVHCTRQLELAVGEISSDQQGSSFLRSKLGKWLIFSTVPWPKGADTPAEMNAKIASFSLTDFETEKKKLLNYLEKARLHTSLKAHPFFGELNRKEWTRLIYKHLDHHLKQFGNRK
jgi:hypothetical protein